MDVDALAAAEDTRMLVVLMDNIRAQLAQVCINPNQSRVLVARLYFVFETLRRMPDPVPTKQLQTVFQSAHALMQWMASNKVYRVKPPSMSSTSVEVKEWAITLCRHFTCKPQFDALRRRLRQVWKLQSTAMWESQDNEAFAADETYNARALLSLVRNDPGASALLREALESIETYSELRTLLNAAAQSSAGDGADDAAFDDEDDDTEAESREAQSDLTTGGRTAKIQQEVVHFFRRRQMGFWRVPFEALTPQPLNRLSAADMALNPFSVNLLTDRSLHSKPASRQVSTQMDSSVPVDIEEENAHDANPNSDSGLSANLYATWLRSSGGMYRFLGAPAAVEELFVVVPETLEQDNSTTPARLAGPAANAEYLTTHPEINVNFVQDIACRCGWCHTNVAEYVGGFTEKIGNCAAVEAPHEKDASGDHEDAETGEDAVVHVPNKKSFATIPTEGYNDDVPAKEKRPVLQVLPTLGMVVHEYGADGYVSLHDVLYTYKHRFSLLQCVEIILQVSDALQYILLDRNEVPKDVALAWLGISPSHVFISTVDWTVRVQAMQAKPPQKEQPKEAESAEPARTSPPKQREEEPAEGQSQSEKGAADPDANDVQVERDDIVPAVLIDNAAAFTDGSELVPTLSTDVDPATNTMEHLTQHFDPTAQILPISNTETVFTTATEPSRNAFSKKNEDAGDVKQQTTTEWKAPIIPIFGSYVVKYSPPAPLSGSDVTAAEESTTRLYSRWEPHPHAANPECYAVIQLFLAMLTNAVPYPQYSTQEQLLENVFAADNELRTAGGAAGLTKQQSVYECDTTAAAQQPGGQSFFQSIFGGGANTKTDNGGGGAGFTSSGSGMVKVSVRRGMRVPGTLPKAVRELCERGLTFSTTNRVGNGSGAFGGPTGSGGALNASTRGTMRRAAGNRNRAAGRTAGSAPTGGGDGGVNSLLGSSSTTRLTLEELRQFFGFVRALVLSDSFGDVDEASWWMPDKDIIDMDDYGQQQCIPTPPHA